MTIWVMLDQPMAGDRLCEETQGLALRRNGNLDLADAAGDVVGLAVLPTTKSLPKLYLRGLLLDGMRTRGVKGFLAGYQARGPQGMIDLILNAVDDLIEDEVEPPSMASAEEMKIVITAADRMSIA